LIKSRDFEPSYITTRKVVVDQPVNREIPFDTVVVADNDDDEF